MAQGQQDNDGGMAPVYVVAVIFILLAAVYLKFHEEVVRFFFIIKTFELKLISLVNPNYELLVNWTDKALTSTVTIQDLYYLALSVGLALRWPLACIAILMAILLYLRHPQAKFKEPYSTSKLADKMSNFFPAVLPVLGKNLDKIPLLEGKWSMALTPVEFAQKYKLIESVDGKNKIIENKAYLVLVQQLGERFVGSFELPKHRQMLFAAFATYVNKDRQTADTYLKEIARYQTNPSRKTEIIINKKTQMLLEKYAQSPKVNKILSMHAYTYTVFTGLLLGARGSGIVSTSSFLWLKAVDRELWYVLNNVGRRAVYAEAGAMHAHWLAESRLKKAITYPMVANAITALQGALDMVLIEEDDE
ncbi:type IVB secretion system coupling complex protein DotM/IcmP [Thiotrichales bacterium 19S3-7]|nr:type IVB secretion system coupling complex protein DotM/IcmP [Thiotrichales bacterium 19S3-7]MCF6800807.1 type IVB secretion system coupling complex protein DotM/IcmP [Thiotrichales bacterium 19S3-11]